VISTLFLLTICKKGVQKYNILRLYPIFFKGIQTPKICISNSGNTGGTRVVNPAAFHIFKGVEGETFVNLNIF
jgi:hypothetical protein